VAPEALTSMLESIPTLVSNEENIELIKPTKEDEILGAIWILELDKAPSPNKFSISFYRSF
jgi:hypothetical protein